jgi:hypothetical protein
MMLSGHMGAYPHSKIGRHIDVSGIRIWLVLIDRRSPVNRDATKNEAKKDRHIQPVTPAHQEMVPPDDDYARLFRQRAPRVRVHSQEVLKGSLTGFFTAWYLETRLE